MIRLEIRNCNMILTENQQKYQQFHLEKLINMNILQVKKYYFLIKDITEQAKFAYSPSGKAFEKHTKTIEDQGEKQIKAIGNRVEKNILDTDKKSIACLFSKGFLKEEATFKLNKIPEIENKLKRDDLIYKTDNKKEDKTYDFQKFKTIRSFGRKIYNNDLLLDDAAEL